MMKLKFFILLLSLASNELIAQNIEKGNKKFDKKKYSIGIHAGLGSQKYQMEETAWQSTNLKDTFNSINSSSSISLHLGLQYERQLYRNIFYRQRFQLSFESSKYKFERKSTILENIKKQNVFIETPIHFIYQVKKELIKPYFFLGISPKISLGQDTGYQKIENYKRLDLGADLGIGVAIKFKNYSISPELCFSNSLINAFKNNQTVYSKTIDKLKRQSITLTVVVKD